MAKKKKRSKSTTITPALGTRKKPAPTRRILLRVPPDLADWLDATAAEVHMHRDVFVRLQLQALREGFEASRHQNSDDPTLFQGFEDRMVKIAEEAIEQAIQRIITTTGGVARGASKHV